MLLGVGEPDLHLSYRIAVQATNARYIEDNAGRLSADGKGTEEAFGVPVNPDGSGAALATAQPITRLFDAEEGVVLGEMLAAIPVATNAEAVIE